MLRRLGRAGGTLRPPTSGCVVDLVHRAGAPAHGPPRTGAGRARTLARVGRRREVDGVRTAAREPPRSRRSAGGAPRSGPRSARTRVYDRVPGLRSVLGGALVPR